MLVSSAVLGDLASACNDFTDSKLASIQRLSGSIDYFLQLKVILKVFSDVSPLLLPMGMGLWSQHEVTLYDY